MLRPAWQASRPSEPGWLVVRACLPHVPSPAHLGSEAVTLAGESVALRLSSSQPPAELCPPVKVTLCTSVSQRSEWPLREGGETVPYNAASTAAVGSFLPPTRIEPLVVLANAPRLMAVRRPARQQARAPGPIMHRPREKARTRAPGGAHSKAKCKLKAAVPPPRRRPRRGCRWSGRGAGRSPGAPPPGAAAPCLRAEQQSASWAGPNGQYPCSSTQGSRAQPDLHACVY